MSKIAKDVKSNPLYNKIIENMSKEEQQMLETSVDSISKSIDEDIIEKLMKLKDAKSDI